MKEETQSHSHRTTPKIVLFVTILFALLIIISLYNPFLSQPLPLLSSSSSSSPSSSSSFSSSVDDAVVVQEEDDPAVSSRTPEICDIFTGEWVPNPRAPYYTNKTCWAIHEHQNCMKYGRPDTEFMKWRWKPDGCELPIFNPAQFLELVKGKSMAFVGDSVARNQMQSMICLLSRVEYPIDISHTTDQNYKRWRYVTYNFTLANFWTPHLVKSAETDPNGPTKTGLFSLHLDEADGKWISEAEEFDYLIVSAGHWFYRPLVFYENKKIVGWIWNCGGKCLAYLPAPSNETGCFTTRTDKRSVRSFWRREEARERGPGIKLLDTISSDVAASTATSAVYGHRRRERGLHNASRHRCSPGRRHGGDFLAEMLKTEGRRSRKRSSAQRLKLKA
ncbi:hypothetical protein NL676_014716 [Syzygium grande]|nr:hypothetical protein NL676_014716 [Syzygium grande]